ncbi:MAG TPA: alpha/beta fold hydrolase [Egibacteraceae bacterium]|nr:alpha/beta fold hydrolase [Egibacteraceae bacterium]
MTSAAVTIAGPDGSVLRGRLRLADGAPRGAVVLCHPHPAFGGNMDVWLLPAIGQALAADGWHVLRFDFRSVRTGVDPRGHLDGHAAERADVAAAVGHLREEGLADGRLVVAGWSFGALVALLHGLDDERVTDWVGIAPAVAPLEELPMSAVPVARVRAWAARRVVVAGEHDQFFAPERMAAVSPHALRVIGGTDHFFFDRDAEVASAVAECLREPAP